MIAGFVCLTCGVDIRDVTITDEHYPVPGTRYRYACHGRVEQRFVSVAEQMHAELGPEIVEVFPDPRLGRELPAHDGVVDALDVEELP